MDLSRVPFLKQVAYEWFGPVDGLLHAAIEDRDRTLAGAGPVLAAIGAMGHELLSIADSSARSRKMANLLDRLRRVRWERGRHWDGIAGKVTAAGVLITGGPKETAYQIFSALNDETSDAYARVRASDAMAA
jgi:DNA sulfur modification protein DndB